MDDAQVVEVVLRVQLGAVLYDAVFIHVFGSGVKSTRVREVLVVPVVKGE